MSKIYKLHGISGLVQRRTCRATGTTISVYHAEQAGLDPDGGPWYTACETHNNLVSHPNLRYAVDWMVEPSWCSECQAILDKRAQEAAEPSFRKPGTLVQTWFDTGARSSWMVVYGVVERAGPKTFTVRWESGLTNRCHYDTHKVELVAKNRLADAEDAMRSGRPKSFPVTDPDLDAPDGAVVNGYERRGDRWVRVEERLGLGYMQGRGAS